MDNESIRTFIVDSLADNPFKEPFIKVKFGPLHHRIGGLTTRISENTYFIQINLGYSLESAQRILMHELIHVHQFNRGWLKELDNRIIWHGDLWSWDIPWADRPWEIQAEEWTDKLYQPEYDK